MAQSKDHIPKWKIPGTARNSRTKSCSSTFQSSSSAALSTQSFLGRLIPWRQLSSAHLWWSWDHHNSLPLSSQLRTVGKDVKSFPALSSHELKDSSTLSTLHLPCLQNYRDHAAMLCQLQKRQPIPAGPQVSELTLMKLVPRQLLWRSLESLQLRQSSQMNLGHH